MGEPSVGVGETSLGWCSLVSRRGYSFPVRLSEVPLGSRGDRSAAMTAIQANKANASRSAGSLTRKLPIGGNRKNAKIRVAQIPPKIAAARPQRKDAAITAKVQSKGAATRLSSSLIMRDSITAAQRQKPIPPTDFRVSCNLDSFGDVFPSFTPIRL